MWRHLSKADGINQNWYRKDLYSWKWSFVTGLHQYAIVVCVYMVYYNCCKNIQLDEWIFAVILSQKMMPIPPLHVHLFFPFIEEDEHVESNFLISFSFSPHCPKFLKAFFVFPDFPVLCCKATKLISREIKAHHFIIVGHFWHFC